MNNNKNTIESFNQLNIDSIIYLILKIENDLKTGEFKYSKKKTKNKILNIINENNAKRIILITYFKTILKQFDYNDKEIPIEEIEKTKHFVRIKYLEYINLLKEELRYGIEYPNFFSSSEIKTFKNIFNYLDVYIEIE